METVNINDLRSNLLKYLETAHSGCQIVVTSNGRLLATISPPLNQRELAKKQLKALASTARIHDVTSPTGAEWEALKCR
jgi:antitoxin (DNA-binding transcriptional repressor) of toxin-antitoxin stability system